MARNQVESLIELGSRLIAFAQAEASERAEMEPEMAAAALELATRYRKKAALPRH